jgi:hypothetical protein
MCGGYYIDQLASAYPRGRQGESKMPEPVVALLEQARANRERAKRAKRLAGEIPTPDIVLTLLDYASAPAPWTTTKRCSGGSRRRRSNVSGGRRTAPTIITRLDREGGSVADINHERRSDGADALTELLRGNADTAIVHRL